MIASPNRITNRADSSDHVLESMDGSLPLAEIFALDCIETLPPSTSKNEAIRCLIESLVNHECLGRQHFNAVTRGIIQRESHGSSAIGKGLAFPHLRTDMVDAFVGAIGVAPQGIEFDSLDQAPTRLIFLTLSPVVRREQHINLLSRLVRMMKDKAVLLQLGHLRNRQEVYRYLRDSDGHPGTTSNSDRPTESGDKRND